MFFFLFLFYFVCSLLFDCSSVCWHNFIIFFFSKKKLFKFWDIATAHTKYKPNKMYIYMVKICINVLNDHHLAKKKIHLLLLFILNSRFVIWSEKKWFYLKYGHLLIWWFMEVFRQHKPSLLQQNNVILMFIFFFCCCYSWCTSVVYSPLSIYSSNFVKTCDLCFCFAITLFCSFDTKI